MTLMDAKYEPKQISTNEVVSVMSDVCTNRKLGKHSSFIFALLFLKH